LRQIILFAVMVPGQKNKTAPCHCAYSMRLSKHIDLEGAWNMRAGVVNFQNPLKAATYA
jgi:hypothetical protein